MKQLYVFSPDVTGEEILRKLRAGAEDFACYDKSCAPPPVGEGGSSKGAGRSSKLAGRITEILKERPGATLNPRAGYKDVTTGFVVSERPDLSYEKPLSDLSAEDIDGWMADNRETLAKVGNHVGIWHDQSTGQVWLDVVRVYPATAKGRRDAVASGIKHNQIAIYDLDNDDEITIGGTGKAISAALTAACRSKACAPPPVGNGGSLPRGAGGSAKMVLPEMTVVSKRSVPDNIAQSQANMDYKGTFKVPSSETIKKTVGKTVDEQVEYFEQRHGIRLSYADDATSGDFAQERYGSLYALDQMAQRYPDTFRDMDVLIDRPPGFSYDMALFRWRTPEGDPTRQMVVSVGGSWILGKDATPNQRRRLYAAAVIHETGHSLTFDAVGRDIDAMQGLAWDLKPQSVGDKLLVRGSSMESVSLYATTNIAEDIAESFTAHILGIDPPDEVGRKHAAQHIEAIAASGAARPDAIAYLYAMAGEEDEPTTASALIELACRSKECAPPPVGRGGSTKSTSGGRQLRDPSAAVGQRGDIYRNLHHGSDDSPVWSVRSGGRVIGHASQVLIANPMFVVGQKARERVLREKSKNVHAFVRGEVAAVNDDVPDVRDGSWRVAKYNPYKYSTFVDSETEEPVTSASEAVLASSTSVYYRP